MLGRVARRLFSSSRHSYHGTTVLSVRKDNRVVMIGDGQVCLGQTKFKSNAVKIRRISPNILCGFAGGTADCLTMFDMVEQEFEKLPKQTLRVCVSIAKQWRSNKAPRNLLCDMIVCDPKLTIVLNGQGDAIEIDEGVVAVGSGGLYAQAAAKALIDIPGMSARQIAEKAMNIAADLCIFTNKEFSIQEIDTTC